MKEEWKDIKDYEGYYQVSNFGQVRSIGRWIEKVTCHGGTCQQYLEGRIRKATPMNKGFLTLVLSKEGIHENFLVHRLVAIAFIPEVEGKPDVDHKDFNKLNNYVENLEWTNDPINNKKLFDAGRTKNTYTSIGRIRHIETGHIYKSCLEACKALSLPYASLNYHIHGQKGMTHVRGNHFEIVLDFCNGYDKIAPT